jgi:hypothetical protein
MAKSLKKHISKDVRKYTWSLERGYGDIPARPLVQPTLEEFEKVFEAKIDKARQDILGVWE